MSIVRIKKHRKFTVIDNHPIEDPSLDFGPLGLLVYLLSKPDNWNISVIHLAKQKKSGKAKIESMLGQLQDLRYATWRRLSNGKTEWVIYEKPQPEYQVKGEPQPEKPDQEKPDQENPSIVNTDIPVKTDNNIGGKKKNYRFIPPDAGEVAKYLSDKGWDHLILAHEFVDFYEAAKWYRGKTKIKDWKACVRTWVYKAKKRKKDQMTISEKSFGQSEVNF